MRKLKIWIISCLLMLSTLSFSSCALTKMSVPSVKELFDIYENKTVIQSSLDIVQGFSFKDVSYWCSSQSASDDLDAYKVNFNDGNVYNSNKNNSDDVFVLQAFNPELFNNYE